MFDYVWLMEMKSYPRSASRWNVGTNLDPSLSPNCPPCCTRSDVPVIAYLCDSSLLPCQFLLHIYCTSRDAAPAAIRKWEKKSRGSLLFKCPLRPPISTAVKYLDAISIRIDAVKRAMSQTNLRKWTGAWRPQLYDPIYISQCSFTPIRPPRRVLCHREKIYGTQRNQWMDSRDPSRRLEILHILFVTAARASRNM